MKFKEAYKLFYWILQKKKKMLKHIIIQNVKFTLEVVQ